MKICLLTKFPPIQGGIATKSYWLARGLAEAGNEVHVVTNACNVEEEYRIAGCEQHLNSLTDISIHTLKDEIPWHIPYSKTYTIRLLNLMVEVIRKYDPHVIDAGFLMPYGIVAYLANIITGVPYIIRHGYSDLAKFFGNHEYNSLLSLVINNANLIVTDNEKAAFFRQMNPRTAIVQPYIPDERLFIPSPRKDTGKTVISYIGKINYHWENKHLIKLVKKIGCMFDQYELVFVAQGKGIEHFKRAVANLIDKPIVFKPFVPPWEMPSLFSSVDYVAVASDTTIQSPSNIQREAQASGKPLIMLNEEDINADISSACGADSYGFTSWIMDNTAAIKESIYR